MGRAKAIFISVYSFVLMACSIYFVIQVIKGGDTIIWWAALLTALPGFLFFVSLFIFYIPRTGKYLPAWTIPILLGFGWLIFQQVNGQAIPLIIWGLSGVCVIGWGLYLFWYSIFDERDKSKLEIGKAMPSVAFESLDGKAVVTDDLNGKPNIYLFYRGNWCPFCMAQIKELAAQYREIEKQGAQLILVSSQPQRHTASLAKKFDIPALFLRDPELKIARHLGILLENGTPLGMGLLGYADDSTMATVVVTDKEGIIRYVDLADNYRIRPEPEAYLNILAGL